MATIPAILGTKQVLQNIQAAEAYVTAGMVRGLKIAGLRLQRESQLMVPVNFVNLKPSAYTRASGTGLRTVVTVGYTAGYALFVHENVEMKLKGQPRPGGRGFFWDPQGRAQAKFLEEPARRLGPELRRIIRNSSRVGPL